MRYHIQITKIPKRHHDKHTVNVKVYQTTKSKKELQRQCSII